MNNDKLEFMVYGYTPSALFVFNIREEKEEEIKMKYSLALETNT